MPQEGRTCKAGPGRSFNDRENRSMKFGMGFMVLMAAAATHPFALVGAVNAENPQQAVSKDGERKSEAPRLTITPFEFGAAGDGVADDTKALQAAVDAAIAKKTALVSPMSAVYAVSAPIEIRGMLNADFQFAEIRAAARMPAVIRYDASPYYTVLRNLRVDAALQADVCVSIVNARKLRLDNLVTGRHLKTALKIDRGYEIFVQNSHFNGTDPDRKSSDVAENTVGIDIATSDCHFSDIVIIDCKTAVVNRGFNFYDRIHAWTAKPAVIIDSVCFDVWSPCIISDSYADTFQICVRVRRKNVECKLIGCGAFYNENLYKAKLGHVEPYLFWMDEGDGRGVSLHSSFMRGTGAMPAHYCNITNCAVSTDVSTSFVRWQGAPVPPKTAADTSKSK